MNRYKRGDKVRFKLLNAFDMTYGEEHEGVIQGDPHMAVNDFAFRVDVSSVSKPDTVKLVPGRDIVNLIIEREQSHEVNDS